MTATAHIRIRTFGRWPHVGDHITAGGHVWEITDQGDHVARDPARAYFLVAGRQVAKTDRADDWFTAGVEAA